MAAFLWREAVAQPDFFKLYKEIKDSLAKKTELIDNDLREIGKGPYSSSDSLKIAAFEKRTEVFYSARVWPVVRRMNGVIFPDIYFSDSQGKSWSLSDFNGLELVINCNYLYCRPCMDRIDSTLKRTVGRQVKMIVLLKEVYKKDYADIKPYDAGVMIGFMNDDTEDLITLNIGHDNMYYLDKTRRVEFFDKSELENGRSAWLKFLDTRFKHAGN